MSYSYSATADSIEALHQQISAEAVKLALALGATKQGAAITATEAAAMQPPTPLEQAIDETKKTAAEPEVPAAKETKKRGRPKKNLNIVDADGDPNFPIIDGNAAEVEGAREAAHADNVTKVVSLDDVRAALKAVQSKHGMAVVLEILKTFEKERISELPAEKYGEFIVACNAKVA